MKRFFLTTLYPRLVMLALLSISISCIIFVSAVADDIDTLSEYESSAAFDEAYDCLQQTFVVYYDGMHRCAKKALEISESFENPDPKKIAMITAKYGFSLSKKSVPEKEKGLKELARASDLIEAAFGSTSCEMASVLFELALVKSEQDLINPAFSDYEKSLSICVTEKNTEYASKIRAFVQSFELEKLNIEQLASAKSFSIKAHDIYQKLKGPSFIGTRAIAFELGKIYFLTEEHQKSIEFFEKSFPPYLGNFRNNMGVSPEVLDQLFSYLSESYKKLGDMRESNKYEGLKSVARLDTSFELDPRIAKTDLMPIFIKQPRYPRGAAALGKEGYAVIELTVLPSGKVRNPRVMEEAPEKFFFGKAAMRVAKKLRYAENPDRPEQKTLYKYTFKMHRNR